MVAVFPALVGAAVVAQPVGFLRVVGYVSRGLFTATGAVVLGGLGLVVAPYVRQRAPLSFGQRMALREDLLHLLRGANHDTENDAGLASKRRDVLELTVEDLEQPVVFWIFCEVARTLFACYSDAAGLMTSIEFRCALHKLIDIAFAYYGPSVEEHSGDGERVARAIAVRELVERVAGGAFRLIDADDDGSIDAAEFVGAVLVVLVVACGSTAHDAPILRRLAFRLVDENGDGYIDQRELLRWVELAVRFETVPEGSMIEPRGPWGLFGTRTLTTAALANKWFRAADVDKKKRLSPEDFAALAPKLRVHEVVRHLAGTFAAQRLGPQVVALPAQGTSVIVE